MTRLVLNRRAVRFHQTQLFTPANDAPVSVPLAANDTRGGDAA